MRATHYLRRSRNAGFPRYSAALVIDAVAKDSGGLQRIKHCVMTRWRCLVWQWRLAQSEELYSGDGRTAESFWVFLDKLAPMAPSLTVWQMGAATGLTLLDFWSACEIGRWQLRTSDLPLQPLAGDDDESDSRAQIVLGDPPTILSARSARTGQNVRWVDVRNLGVSDWRDIPAGKNRLDALQRFVRRWYDAVRDLNLGGLRYTAGAQAWAGFRHSYLKTPMLVHGNSEALTLERQALHGGRCEVFRFGRIAGPVYNLDARAHYPACACSGPLPCRFNRIEACDLDKLIEWQSQGWLTIAECTIETGIPCSPYRWKDLTLFPTGRFRTVLCQPEIDLALMCGAMAQVHRAARYEPDRPVDEFILQLWARRKSSEISGDDLGKAVYKRLMNSLISKFAQWDKRWLDSDQCLPPAPFAQWEGPGPDLQGRVRWRSIGWRTQYETVQGEPIDSMPAITAWVNSVARVRLWEWINCAGRGNVYYCDTDSVWVNNEGAGRLQRWHHVDPGVIGKLDCDGVYEWFEPLGYKYYAVPGEIVCAGVSKGAVLTTGDGFDFWHGERVTDVIRHQRAPQPVLRGLHVPESRPYRHGHVWPDGSVSPFVVGVPEYEVD